MGGGRAGSGLFESHGFGRGFFMRSAKSGSLIWDGSGGGVGEGDQLTHGILFLRKRGCSFWIEDREHVAAMNSPHQESIALDANHAIFFVEN